MKLYTLFKTEDSENDSLTVGTSLYRKYMGVPPPPPRGGGRAGAIEGGSFIFMQLKRVRATKNDVRSMGSVKTLRRNSHNKMTFATFSSLFEKMLGMTLAK